MSSTKEPVFVSPRLVEPSSDLDIARVVTDLKLASSAAGDALDAKSHDDYDRGVTLDGTVVELRAVVDEVVQRCVAGLKKAEQAIEAAS